MTIENALKETINNAFRFTQFIERDQASVERMLRTKVKGSNTVTLFPTFAEVVVLDENTWNVHFDDYTLHCIVRWKKTDTHWVFMLVE